MSVALLFSSFHLTHHHNRGSIHTSVDDHDIARAKILRDIIISGQQLGRPHSEGKTVRGQEWEQSIQRNAENSLPKLKALVGQKMRGGGGRM